MTEFKALSAVFRNSDESFFISYCDRYSHIRLPFKGEMEGEFFSLGDHERDRRRILLYRLPENSPFFDPKKPIIMKIPFLLFADETVEDRDDILLPIIHEIMISEAKRYGAK